MILTLDKDRFDVRTGSREYVYNVSGGDRQIDYLILSDCECQLYVAFGDLVVPVAVGTSLRGRLLVKDAGWLLVKVSKPSALVAATVTMEERRVVDKNNGVPVAAHVPEMPPVDLRTMVSRLVGQRLEAQGEHLIERDGPELPDDIDEEFGLGSTQMEEDDELEEILINAARKRKAAKAEAPGERPGGEGGAESENGGGEKRQRGAKPQKPAKKAAKVEDPVEEE